MPEILIAAVVVAFFAVFLFKLKKTPAGLGKGGEKKVSAILSRFGTVYDNYTYLDGKKHVKKVEHILVNCNGVFVVKSLKYAGGLLAKISSLKFNFIVATPFSSTFVTILPL